MSTRGEHLLHADRRFATGGGLVARLTAPAFAKVLDEIDRRLAKGGIDATLPDGTRRRLGFNAKGPTAAVRLSSWRALVRLATSGSVGWYKAWALGEWSSPDPVKVFELFSANAVPLGNVGRAKGPFRWVNRIAHRLRDNAPGKARANIAAHYDLGNDFYSAWLDATMTYSSARFATPKDTLEQGQLRKVHMLLDRLQLEPGQRLLEIGCGWGTLAIEAAKRGVSVVGLTLSTEQKAWAESKIADVGLQDRIEIRLQDYRDIPGQFDRVTSVGMFEHVGRKNLPTYFSKVRELLAEDGIAMNHGITSTDYDSGETALGGGEFIDRYVFPDGELPHISLALESLQRGGLEAVDIESLRRHYARTLNIWTENFEAHADEARKLVDDEKFRIWRLYLAGCAYAFEHDDVSIYQIVCRRAGRSRRHKC